MACVRRPLLLHQCQNYTIYSPSLEVSERHKMPPSPPFLLDLLAWLSQSVMHSSGMQDVAGLCKIPRSADSWGLSALLSWLLSCDLGTNFPSLRSGWVNTYNVACHDSGEGLLPFTGERKFTRTGWLGLACPGILWHWIASLGMTLLVLQGHKTVSLTLTSLYT